MFVALLTMVLSVQAPAEPAQTTARQSEAPQAQLELAPGTRYQTNVPTLKQVAGHEFGERISTPEEIVAYLKALAAAVPDRTRLIEYGRSWEGRPLYVILIGSADRLGKLDAIKAGLSRLADPRGLGQSAGERLVRELPVVVWLMHSVHGNEITSSDAALAEAYHLLAAQGDTTADAILREALVLIDPLQNPDGRARFVAVNRQASGPQADPEPASAEHDEPWPGGRSNHYLFDMNRDWLAQSQVETQGRARLGLEWRPQVVVDLHEMGSDSTYYFAPPAEPANPYITPRQREWLTTFGRENASKFDSRGFAYFVREVFDAFYPGYGDSWPMFQGAISMTYEQASPRGLIVRRGDDTHLTYRDGVVQHFTAALQTMATAATNREKLLGDYLEFRRSAIAEGEKATVREYLVPPGSDPSRTETFARHLVRHGIEVRRVDEEIKLGAQILPKGTVAVSAAQPSFRLLRNLMESDVRMDDAFLKEQERRRQKRLGDQIYDVTAWSLPLLYDVEVVTSDKPVTAKATPIVASETAPAPTFAAARMAYLIPWGSGAASAVGEALRTGIKVRSAGETFTIGARTFGVGTAIVRVAENPADLHQRLRDIAAKSGAEVVPLDSSWVDKGMSLGSNEVSILKTPKVLLAWDSPVSGQSAGWARYVLEQRFKQPVTVVRTSSLRRIDMSRYNVLVLPSGSYGLFGDEDIRRLKDWISGGRVLITLAEASRWAAGEKVGLLSTAPEMRDGKPAPKEEDKDAKKPAGDAKKPFDYEQAIQPERESPEPVPGALLRVVLDPEHWMASGLDGEIQVIVEGSRVFTPVKLDKGRNVGIYAKKDRLVAGGHAWPGSQEQLAQKAFLIAQPLGRGHVIAFAEDPNFRATSEATSLLFMNAVLLGPGR